MSNNNQNGASLQKRMEVQRDINKYKVDIDISVFKKTDSERLRVSKEKSEYKANFNRPKFKAERNDLLGSFAHAAKTMKPRMNVNLIVL